MNIIHKFHPGLRKQKIYLYRKTPLNSLSILIILKRDNINNFTYMNVLKAFPPKIISFYMAYHFPLVFLFIFNSLLFSDFEYETVPALFLTCQLKFVVQSITSTYHIHECRRGGGKSLTCNIPKRWCSIDIPPLRNLVHFH